MTEAVFLTPEGLEKLKKELEHLKIVERIKVAEMIGEAKSFGDLSENSEYDSAKNKEAQLESKIYEIEQKLKNYIIIDKNDINTTKVSVGCNVTLFDEEFKEEITYKIIGSTESDPSNGFISNESPIGKALMNKKEGEQVEVETPGGVINFKILKIFV